MLRPERAGQRECLVDKTLSEQQPSMFSGAQENQHDWSMYGVQERKRLDHHLRLINTKEFGFSSM